MQTERGLDFFGYWNFMIMHGWLIEKREDHSNPMIWGARISYMPARWVEFGATRTLLYGGEGRPDYGIKDYPYIIIGKGENTPGDKYDNEGHAALDISFIIPLHRWFSSVWSMKLYYQVFATDIAVPWIEDESKDSNLTFPLWDRSHMLGMNFITENSYFAIEYVFTNESYLSNHNYDEEGYTYKDMSLGYPFGRDKASVILRHHYYLTDRFSFEYRLAFTRTPVYQEGSYYEGWYNFWLRDLDQRKKKEKVPVSYHNFISLKFTYATRHVIIKTYARVDGLTNYDTAPRPSKVTISGNDKNYWTTGISFKYRL